MVSIFIDLQWFLDLPAGFHNSGELTLVSLVSKADPAQSKLAIDCMRPAANLAARVGLDGKLRLPLGLGYKRFFRQFYSSLKGNPRRLNMKRASSSVLAEVTIAMSIPLR